MTGSELRRLRERLKLTEAEFGARLGVTHAAVSRWETGKRPISEQVARHVALLFGGRRGRAKALDLSAISDRLGPEA